MKTLSLILLMSLFTLPAFGALTPEDLRQIDEIVQKSEARMKEYIKEYVDSKVQVLDIKITSLDTKFSTKIDGLDTKFSTKIDELDKRLQILFALVVALIALVAGAIVIPQVIIAFKEKGTAPLQEQINQLRQKLEALEQSRVLRP
jgi:ABC-type transport system involved in cytochrome bd biosynthesis fused ATPase/permease subunit